MKTIIALAAACSLATACAHTPREHSYGNDALPSAEMLAFQQVDGRLKWRDARIEFDANSCAVYEGTAPDGQRRREPLTGPDNRPLCPRR